MKVGWVKLNEKVLHHFAKFTIVIKGLMKSYERISTREIVGQTRFTYIQKMSDCKKMIYLDSPNNSENPSNMRESVYKERRSNATVYGRVTGRDT